MSLFTENDTSLVFDSIIYNDFKFPAVKHKKISEEYVYNDNETAIKYMRLSIEISCVVTPEHIAYQTGKTVSDITSNLTTYMDLLRSKLNKPGKEFVFLDTGYGNIVVNVEEANRGDFPIATNKLYHDLERGPRPKILDTRVIARDKAFMLTWSVVIAIPHCANDETTGDDETGIIAFEYEVEHAFSDEGLLRRTTEGYIEVPSYYTGHDPVTNRETYYRAQIAARIKWITNNNGFKREQTWSWSADRRRYSFNIVDTEIPSDNPLYPGTLDMDLIHETHSSLYGGGITSAGAGFTRWGNILSGSITLAPGTPRDVSWWAFRDVFLQRVASLAAYSSTRVTNQGDIVTQSTYVILDLRVREHIHKRRFDYSLKWITTIDIANALEGQGFFLLSSTSTWDAHRLEPNANKAIHTPRRATIAFEDVDEDFCTPPTTPGAKSNNGEPSSPGNPGSQHIWVDSISPSQSYLAYKNDLDTEEESQTVYHQRTKQLPETTNQDNNQSDTSDPDAGNIPALQGADSTESIIQVRGPGTYKVSMRGFAIRVGYKPTPPVLLSVAGATATRLGGRWKATPISSSKDYPVYLAMWDQQYILSKLPQPSEDFSNAIVSNGDPGLYV